MNMQNQEKEKKSKICLFLNILLGAAVIVLGIMLYTTKTNTQETISQKVDENIQLNFELDSMLSEYQIVKDNAGVMADSLSHKDSIILANAAEIKQLLAVKADYRRIKRKLDYLRGITQGYVHQIDSLFTANQHLQDENTRIRHQVATEKGRSLQLTKEKELLTEKVEIAAMLKAYNISASAYRLRGRKNTPVETTKASRTERIEVCFNLGQNLLAEGGPRDVYIQIARPDKVVMCPGNPKLYTFMFNGEMLTYSLKKNITYNNKSMKVCMFWDKDDPDAKAMPGTYNITIFMDGYEIGQSSVTLQ